jgi:hypothetical protein
MAQSGHPDTLNQCPLLGVKRTSKLLMRMKGLELSERGKAARAVAKVIGT